MLGWLCVLRNRDPIVDGCAAGHDAVQARVCKITPTDSMMTSNGLNRLAPYIAHTDTG